MQNKSLNEFDPNVAFKDVHATYVPARRPPWKLHQSRAAALQAMSGWTYTALYKFVDDGWKLQVRMAREDFNQTCSNCFQSTLRTHAQRPFYGNNGNQYTPSYWKLVDTHVYDTGQFFWVKEKGKIVDPPRVRFLCENCA